MSDYHKHIALPVIHVDCTAWGEQVPMRRMSAGQLLDVLDRFGDVQLDSLTSRRALEMAADVLAICCVDPAWTAQEWLDNATMQTVVELGSQAMAANGLLPDEQKKSD